jgi:cell division protein FtsZ
MIELNRSYHFSQNPDQPVPVELPCIKVIGLGGAGCNALDRIILNGIENAGLVAINTDAQSLTSCVAPEKIQLGHVATRGLGAGGDPELGVAAAEEAVEAIRECVEGAAMVFLCVGLGGGTGSGAAPLVTQIAKESGALVVVFATMPFSFEGRRRRLQAEEALYHMQQIADAVICFENDRMGDGVSPKAGIQQAFTSADQAIGQSVRAISELCSRRGLIHIGFDDLVTALRSQNARCVFGFGEADGDNRAHDALARALKNPLMERGAMLSEAENILVNVSGGPGMTLNEVQILMEELNRHIHDQSRILFGASVDPRLGNRMNVTIISSVGSAESVVAPAQRVVREEVTAELQPQTAEAEAPQETVEVTRVTAAEDQMEQAALIPPADQVKKPKPGKPATPTQRPKPVMTRPPKAATPEPASPASAKALPQPRQETLQFEPTTRGRFEKSEPTIVDGEDLDVPTFMRRNVRVK